LENQEVPRHVAEKEAHQHDSTCSSHV
jgi:hypothetical protein